MYAGESLKHDFENSAYGIYKNGPQEGQFNSRRKDGLNGKHREIPIMYLVLIFVLVGFFWRVVFAKSCPACHV